MMLVTRVGGIACALPTAHVVEIMRPLPIERVAEIAPAVSFLLGVAIVRGSPIPVLDAAPLLGHSAGERTRFVVLRTGVMGAADPDRKRLALLVDAVVGVRPFQPSALAQLPPLLRDASREVVASIGTLDDGLLVVLNAGRLLPPAAWGALRPGTA
jgi:purine-binding chemotaxis protein CheW